MLQNYENTPSTRGIYRRGGYTYLLLFNLISFMTRAQKRLAAYVTKKQAVEKRLQSAMGRKYTPIISK